MIPDQAAPEQPPAPPAPASTALPEPPKPSITPSRYLSFPVLSDPSQKHIKKPNQIYILFQPQYYHHSWAQKYDVHYGYFQRLYPWWSDKLQREVNPWMEVNNDGLPYTPLFAFNQHLEDFESEEWQGRLKEFHDGKIQRAVDALEDPYFFSERYGEYLGVPNKKYCPETYAGAKELIKHVQSLAKVEEEKWRQAVKEREKEREEEENRRKKNLLSPPLTCLEGQSELESEQEGVLAKEKEKEREREEMRERMGVEQTKRRVMEQRNQTYLWECERRRTMGQEIEFEEIDLERGLGEDGVGVFGEERSGGGGKKETEGQVEKEKKEEEEEDQRKENIDS